MFVYGYQMLAIYLYVVLILQLRPWGVRAPTRRPTCCATPCSSLCTHRQYIDFAILLCAINRYITNKVCKCKL